MISQSLIDEIILKLKEEGILAFSAAQLVKHCIERSQELQTITSQTIYKLVRQKPGILKLFHSHSELICHGFATCVNEKCLKYNLKIFSHCSCDPEKLQSYLKSNFPDLSPEENKSFPSLRVLCTTLTFSGRGGRCCLKTSR
jgi:hypothetical protein